MFVFTAKASKPKLILFLLILALALILLCYGIFGGTKKQDNNNQKASANNISERENFLKGYGWQIDKTTENAKSINIPSLFDEVYKPYNELQQNSGFDLANYKGKEVDSFTYKVVNYPDLPDNVFATLLVYQGKVIGGDVHCNALDGFMHGLDLKGTGLKFDPTKSSEDNTEAVATSMTTTGKAKGNNKTSGGK
ncbi:MAG: hypothetical protein BGN88_09135 [Clostridiales bacterium 43-6]|nr:MAG: hypothetical protein BGN88_09135 [Clostridiales bacterium 43-6]